MKRCVAWLIGCVVLLLVGCASQQMLPPEETPFLTAVRHDSAASDPAGAEAWVNDVDTVDGFVATGRMLYQADPSKKTAGQYCDDGNALTDRGEFRRALRMKSEALYLARQKSDLVLSAHCASGIALAYDYADDAGRATFWADEALSYLGQAQPEPKDDRPSYVKGIATKVLGDSALKDGDPAKAVGYFTQALEAADRYTLLRPWVLLGLANAMLAQQRFPEAAAYIGQARPLQDKSLEAVADRLLGELALKQGNVTAARQRFAAAAQRAREISDDYGLAWAERGIAQVDAAQNQLAAAADAYRAASEAAGRLRGRFHTEEFRSSVFGSLQTIFDEAIATEVALNRPGSAFDLSEQSRTRTLEDMIRSRVRLNPVAPVSSLAQLQATIPGGTALLDYYTLPGSTLLWTVRHGSVSLVQIPLGRDALYTRIKEFRAAITSRSRHATESAAEYLYGFLVEPAHLAKEEAVVIVPHGDLHYLPFSALRDRGQWMVQQRPVSYAISTTAFAQASERPPAQPLSILALGDPDLGDPAAALPAAASEVRAIREQFPAASIFVGKEATRERFVTDAPAVGVAHIAAHAVIDHVDPIFSAIWLAGPTPLKGRLEAHDVYGLPLSKVDLVVLSGCATGMGAVVNGDESYGFTPAFLASGARNVMVTLWPIDDASTAVLMHSFYTDLPSQRFAGALQQAQRRMIAGGTYTDPFFWAAFGLVGDDPAIPVQKLAGLRFDHTGKLIPPRRTLPPDEAAVDDLIPIALRDGL